MRVCVLESIKNMGKSMLVHSLKVPKVFCIPASCIHSTHTHKSFPGNYVLALESVFAYNIVGVCV